MEMRLRQGDKKVRFEKMPNLEPKTSIWSSFAPLLIPPKIIYNTIKYAYVLLLPIPIEDNFFQSQIGY